MNEERRVLLPDVRRFEELFTFVREWDHATMTPVSGVVHRPDLVPMPALVDDMSIGPFLSAQLAGGVRRAMAVEATPLTINAIALPSQLFATLKNEGSVSFHMIEHQDGRVLVVAQESSMSRGLWLAYIDPQSIPAHRNAEGN